MPREIPNAELVAFTAQTRMSGVDFDGNSIRKGAADSVRRWVVEQGGTVPDELETIVDGIATQGGTPLVVANGTSVLGVIYLKDVVKQGMRERFDQMRAMGIRTVMITGDNPRTAAAIAEEAGVDDFLAEATPEDKMALIKREQLGGSMVAMTGDGTNDAPALAVADVGVAMNTGTQAAKEAGNMVDLDSNPTKLIEIVEIGKQLLITRGSLTTFSIANDIAKYFAIIPAMFAGVFPQLDSLNIMQLEQPAHRDPVGGDLQRARHRVADPACVAGREVPGDGCGRDPAPQPLDLRPGRDHRPVHRDQAHRHRRHRVGSALMLRRQFVTGLLMTVVLTVLFGFVYPLAVTGISQLTMSKTCERFAGEGERQGRRFVADRPELHRCQAATRCVQYFQPRPSAARYDDGYDATSASRTARTSDPVELTTPARTTSTDPTRRPRYRQGCNERADRATRSTVARRRGDRHPARASTRRSRSRTPGCRRRAWRRRATSPSPR